MLRSIGTFLERLGGIHPDAKKLVTVHNGW